MTTEQVWALHDAMPERLRAAVLVGALVGLRAGEVCGLRVSDVDFMRGIVHPTVQFPAEPLKTETSQTAVPIPHDLALELSAHVAEHSRGSQWVLVNEWGQQLTPWTLERAWTAAKQKVPGVPTDLRFHDLRHYLASMLIDSGASVKVVQARMRHASAKVTLDCYGHLFPDSDESSRAAISSMMALRPQAEERSGT
jgi:integrase